MEIGIKKQSRRRILAISGSTKQHSSNASILEYIAKEYSHQADVDLYEGLDSLPHFNPDLDHEHPPALVQDLRARIHMADGVLFCTPEYVFSLPGSLKNAIEWTVSTTVFSNKPVALIVAAASGEKAFEALELIMTTIEARIAKNAKLLIRGVKGKVGAHGQIKGQDTANHIRKVADALLESIGEDNQVPTKYAAS